MQIQDLEKAADYYVKVLGFHFDWGNDQGGIGGISKEHAWLRRARRGNPDWL